MIEIDAKVIDCSSPKTGRIALIIVDLHDCMRPVTGVVVKWDDETISTIKADQLVDRDGFLELIP